MILIPDFIGLTTAPCYKLSVSCKKLFQECLWTAHGYKRLPAPRDLSWHRDQYGESIPAMPHLNEVLTQEHFQLLLSSMSQRIHIWSLSPTLAMFAGSLSSSIRQLIRNRAILTP